MAIDPDFLDSVLDPLAQIFRARTGGDTDAARLLAERALAAHRPADDHELTIAAHTLALGVRSLQLLGQSAADDVPPEKAVRLCASAVTMGRESLRMRGVLQDMQAHRGAESDNPAEPAQQPQADPPGADPARPPAQQAIDLVELTREAIEAVKKGQGKALAQRLTKQQMLQRMAENSRRAKERHESRQQVAAALAPPGQGN